MDLSFFDIIVTVIVLLLGLKGVINGLFKELFALIGIVGGIFIASRIGDDVGEILSNLIFNFQSKAVIAFSGFLVALALFWLLMIGAGTLFKKLSAITGLGMADRVFGFIFGASKFFLITSVIAYAAYNIKIMQSTLDDTFKSSALFPVMVATGATL